MAVEGDERYVEKIPAAEAGDGEPDAATAASGTKQEPEPEPEPVQTAESTDSSEALAQPATANATQAGALQLTLVMIALCLAVFLCGLDQTILSTAVPIISNDFHALNDIAWWSSAFLLTMATFQLFYGKLYTLFPVKTIFLLAIALFEIGSIICAAAPNSVVLIIGRAIAGTGGAGIFSGSILILTVLIPLERRAAYTGMIASTFGVAAVVGPFIGGALTDGATWRWCFGINPPIGAVIIVIIGFFMKGQKVAVLQHSSWTDKIKEFDIPGTLTLIVSVVCLLLALEYGGVLYPWSNSRVIALLVLFGVFFTGFLALHQFRKSVKTIPTTVVRNRYYWFGTLFGLCVSGAIYVAIIYLPIWFQSVKGATALGSGEMVSALIVAYVVFSIIGGIATSVLGFYMPVMIASTILSSVGAGLMTTFKADMGNPQWIGYQILYGFGVGLGIQNSILVAQTVLSITDVPIGVALTIMIQNLGGSIFIAIAQSTFQNNLRQDLTRAVPGFDQAVLRSTGATDLSSFFNDDELPMIYDIYTDALVKVLYIVLALSCVSIIGALGAGTHNIKTVQQSRPDGEDGEGA